MKEETMAKKSPKTDPEFKKFLIKKGVRLKGNMIHMADVDKLEKLQKDFILKQASKTGLPASLQKHAESVVTFEVPLAPRIDQTPEKYDVEILDSTKNYDEDDTWSGTLSGTVENLWKALTKQDYGYDVDDIEEILLDSIKYKKLVEESSKKNKK
jgi:hypothetical protein